MKNIHVLPTNKPSRLIINWEKDLCYKSKPYLMEGTQNIYITSDEEIKEGDYMYDIDGDVGKAIGSDMKEFEGNKKIILTTDIDLINDGVQAIPDDFLEWFVKNPSCEEVRVEKIECQMWSLIGCNKDDVGCCGKPFKGYKIIIPQEETQQAEIEQASIELVQDGTIEGYYDTFAYYEKKGFVKGVKWHHKRSYSEEEAGELVYNIIGEYAKEYGITIDGAKLNDLFNQFKKQ
jgi:hypothetical protein